MVLSDDDISCNEDVLNNSELCRAKRVSHTISSLDFNRMCKQFRKEVDKEHICIPMIIGSSTGGVVQFVVNNSENNNSNKEKIKRKVYKAEEYIRESRNVIEAKKLTNTLKECSLRDDLTGLYNRRFLHDFIECIVPGDYKERQEYRSNNVRPRFF